MAVADADEGHSRMPKQNIGGSDALCFGAPTVSGKPSREKLTEDYLNKNRTNHIFLCELCDLCGLSERPQMDKLP